MQVRKSLLTSIFCGLVATVFAGQSLNKKSEFFIENKGQHELPDEIRYYTSHNGQSLFLRNTGVSYVTESLDGGIQRIDLNFITSNNQPTLVAIDELSGLSQFYQSSQAFTEAKHYRSVKYVNLYDHIDLVYHFQPNGSLKYEFVVREGGRYEDIRIAYSGLEKAPFINETGILSLPTISGDINEMAPITFYENGDTLKSSYELTGKVLSFQLEVHNPHKTVIIDPEIVWSTYHGGQNNENALAVGYDSLYNIYVLGQTWSPNFPVTAGAHQKKFAGNSDLFISKFDPSGSLSWCTYYGGPGKDFAGGISVTPEGFIHIIGTTNSAFMEYGNNPHQASRAGGTDAFLALFNKKGHLIRSSYFGGALNDVGKDIIVHPDGDIFITGHTLSTDFKTTPKAFQPAHSDTLDGYISKFDSSGQLIWSTYFGGNGVDELRAICLDRYANIYVTGTTSSEDFPVKSNPLQDTLDGEFDACIAKLDSSGQLYWSSYYGGDELDAANDIVLDDNENVYITGSTSSPNLYISGNDTLQDTIGGGLSDAFVLKLSTSGTHQWSTFYGGTGEDVATSIDWYHTALLITGYTKSKDLKTFHQAGKSPLQARKKGGYDGFHANLSVKTGLLYVSSYMGGDDDDYLYEGKFYFGGQVLIGSSQSSNFRISAVSQQQLNAGKKDAVITTICPDVFKAISGSFCTETEDIKMIDADSFKADYPITYQWQKRTLFDWKDIPGETQHYLPKSKVQQRTYFRRIYKAGMCQDTSLYNTVYLGPIPKVGLSFNNNECTPDTIRFKNKTTISAGSFTQRWFTNTAIYRSFNTEHVYTKPGAYIVRLVVTADSGCVRRDYGVVNMRRVPTANFEMIAQCNKDSITFMNSSLTDSYLLPRWDMGDGGKSELDSFRHPYALPGKYNVKLHVKSVYGCEDSVTKNIQVDSIIKAKFKAYTSCPNDSIAFQNLSLAGKDSLLYFWDFGDGTKSQEKEPKHLFAKKGTYRVHLKVSTLTGCVDSTARSVLIIDPPEAEASFTTYCEHDTTLFEANWTSPDTTYHYTWKLGDGKTIVDQTSLKYVYKKHGKYTAVFQTSIGTKGCIRTQELDVLHDSIIQSDFGVANICENQTPLFRNKSKLSSGKISWLWFLGNGDESTSKDPSTGPYKLGNYVVTLIVRSDKGCSDTISKTFKVSPKPIADFTFKEVCFGESVSFINISSVQDGKIISSIWNFGDGQSSSQENPAHMYQGGGRSYSVNLKVRTEDGCTMLTQKMVRQAPKITTKVDAIRDASCFGKKDGYAKVSASGGTGSMSYEWQTNPVVKSQILEDIGAGTYVVQITDEAGCKVDYTARVRSPGKISVSPFEDKQICRGDSLVIGAVVNGGRGPYQYSWICNRSACNIQKANGRYITVVPQYKTTYILRVTDALFCHSEPQRINVKPLEKVKIDAGKTRYAVRDVPIQLQASTDTIGAFAWSPAEFLDDPHRIDPWAQIYRTTVFEVTFSSDKFCDASDTVRVNVVNGFEFASAFTPNGDGVNDTWKIKEIRYFPNCKVSIFNRWGSEIYVSHGYDKPWDGYHSGKKMPAGTYYYVIDLNNGSEPFTGPVTILE